jgi:hypothetical protein
MDPKAKQFKEKINSINSSFLSALDDFKKYYVFYHKNPEVDEYSNHFVNSKGQLQALSGEMFATTNIIQKNIETLNDTMEEISSKLTNEKDKYAKMDKLFTSLKGTESGSNILINDSKTEFNLLFFKNIELFIGILIILGLMVSPKMAMILLVIALLISYNLGIMKVVLPVIGYI